MIKCLGDRVKEAHSQVVVIWMAVAVGLPFKGLKEGKPAELFIQALVRLVKGPRSPTFLHVRPHQRRHLSLNTPLMKVIHFNGASFQTVVIKAFAVHLTGKLLRRREGLCSK